MSCIKYFPRQQGDCRKSKSCKWCPKTRCKSILSLDRLRNGWMYENLKILKNFPSAQMEQNKCNSEHRSPRCRDMETQTSSSMCACQCLCEHRHEVHINRQRAGKHAEDDQMTHRSSSERVSFFDLHRKRLQYMHRGIYVTAEYLLEKQKEHLKKIKQAQISSITSSQVESETESSANWNQDGNQAEHSVRSNMASDVEYEMEYDMEYDVEYDVEDGEETEVEYDVEHNVELLELEDDVESDVADVDDDVEYECENERTCDVNYYDDFEYDDDASYSTASRSFLRCTSEMSRDYGGQERSQRSINSGYLHLLSTRNESVPPPKCMQKAKERSRSFSPRYCRQSSLNMLQTVPPTNQQRLMTTNSPNKPSMTEDRQAPCPCRHCSSRSAEHGSDLVKLQTHGTNPLFFPNYHRQCEPNCMPMRQVHAQQAKQVETPHSTSKAKAKCSCNTCDAALDNAGSHARPAASNLDATQEPSSPASSAESLLVLRSTNTLTDVWHRAGLLEGHTYMDTSKEPRRSGGLCTHAVLQQATQGDEDEELPSKAEREVEMTKRLLQLRVFQSLAGAHFKRCRARKDCCDINAFGRLFGTLWRCPLEKADCPLLLNEEFLAHVLRRHISEPGIELREIFEGDRLLLVFNTRAFQLGTSACLSVLAYNGFRGLNAVLPIRAYKPVINADLPTPFSQFGCHVPIMLMICRSKCKAAHVRKKRVHFADEPLELHAQRDKREQVTLWVVSMEQPKPIYVMLTVFSKNMMTTRTAILPVRSLLKSNDVTDCLGPDSTHMRLSDSDVWLLSNFDDDAIYLELTVREYGAS